MFSICTHLHEKRRRSSGRGSTSRGCLNGRGALDHLGRGWGNIGNSTEGCIFGFSRQREENILIMDTRLLLLWGSSLPVRPQARRTATTNNWQLTLFTAPKRGDDQRGGAETAGVQINLTLQGYRIQILHVNLRHMCDSSFKKMCAVFMWSN